MATPNNVEKLFATPVGYIGWGEHYNKGINQNVYLANVNSKDVDEYYQQHASTVQLEMVKIIPKEKHSLEEVFFKTKRNFSYYQDHADFTISTHKTNMSILDFLNFIPKADMSLITDESERMFREQQQNIMLSAFVSAYRGLESCKIDFEGKPINSGETYDKREQIRRSLAYGPSDMVLYEEAMISPLNNSVVPSGSIDFIMFSQSTGEVLAIKNNKTVVQVPSQFATTTSTKTTNTFDDPGSERQVTVELLAFSQVTFPADPYQGVLMLKASEKQFKPYIYYPHLDLLLTTSNFIQLPPPEIPCMNVSEFMGSFILFMFLHHHTNSVHFIDALGNNVVLCGWKESLSKSGMKYSDYIQPQTKRKRPVSKIPIECPPTNRKIGKYAKLEHGIR